MKPAALGFRVHSGWACMAGVTIDGGVLRLLLCERPQLVETFTFEFRQPYHTAERMPIDEARAFIARMQTEAQSLAYRAVHSAGENLREQGYEVKRYGLLVTNARPLPELPGILASHALIHTADGEHFREALIHACGKHSLRAAIVRESEVFELACRSLQLEAGELESRMADVGRAHGSPWTKDEKLATLAAVVSVFGTA
jgi:hypothetical protein